MVHTIKYIFIFFIFISSSLLNANETGHDKYSHIDHAESESVFTKEEIEYIKNKKQIVMCTDPDWMPYEKFDENGDYIGVAADYHKIISHITGLEYIFLKTETWAETLERAKAGECDILSILNQTQDRDSYLNFTRPYIKSPSIFVTRERDKFINGIGDLEGRTLATVKGYKIDEIIQRDHPEIKRIHAPNIIKALEMVSRGKAFSTAGSLLEMSYNIRQQGMLNLKITGDAKFGYELAVGVKKDDLLLLSVIDKTLAQISKPDQDRILNKWISINYHQSYDYRFIWKIIGFFLVIIVLIAARFIITSKYNKKLIALNTDLTNIKNELENSNLNLEHKVAEETAKRLENERLLMQQSKLAAMGDMIGAIAHQWRQPLTAVAMYIQDIEDAYDSNSLDKTHLRLTVDKSMAIIKQMSGTIDDFSNFFKPDKSTACFHVNKVIIEAVAMFLPQMNSHGIIFSCITDSKEHFLSGESAEDLSTECAPVYIEGYPNEFKHVVINLIKNSLDAISETKPELKKISVEITVDQEGCCVIKFADTAGGIAKEIVPRIFEPYFSTKQEGQGVGIGLYMSRQIINNMNGKIWFENTNDGAAFYIKIKTCTP